MRLTRDRTVKPVLRDQILWRERGQGNIHFPCSTDHRQVGSLTRLIHTLLYKVCDDDGHTYTQYIIHNIQ